MKKPKIGITEIMKNGDPEGEVPELSEFALDTKELSIVQALVSSSPGETT